MRIGTSLAAVAAFALALPAAQPASAQLGGLTKPLSSIFGCEASGSKQVVGAAVGGVVGGVVGSKVSDGTLGTVVGAALGAAAGSYIGCRMQKSDQQKAEAAARQALERNSNVAWTNPATGASGNVRMVSATPVSMAGIRLASGVELASGYEGVTGQYKARSAANLRASPSASAKVVGKLKAGESFDSLARVAGSNWLLAGRNGLGLGYVSETLVAPAASANGACRTFDQTLTAANGAPETQRYTACKNPAGEWVVQA